MPTLSSDLPTQRIVSDSRDITQSNLALGLPALSRGDPDRYALIILNSILGRGMSSRLFKEVRERRGLAYSVGSSISRHSDTGTLVVSAGVSPENGVEAVRVILDELEKLVQEPVGDEEMTKARDYAVGSFRLSLESTMSLGQRAGENLLTLGEIEPIDSVAERLKSITAEDVMRVARRILKREKAALAVVGPSVDETAFLDVLAV
jgi:predicted Zn-dependent peptidase